MFDAVIPELAGREPGTKCDGAAPKEHLSCPNCPSSAVVKWEGHVDHIIGLNLGQVIDGYGHLKESARELEEAESTRTTC